MGAQVRLRLLSPTLFSRLFMMVLCRVCRGTGRLLSDVCPLCDGLPLETPLPLLDEEILELLADCNAEEEAIGHALAALALKIKDPSMVPTRLQVTDFLDAASAGPGSPPIIDVRSPGEFEHARIPGAHSLPLFSDSERAEVGTAYSKKSRETAMLIGMRYVASKLERLVDTARQLALSSGQSDAQPLRVAVHCWRGGMRSGAVAWLLRRHGLEVCTLAGGYKAYRTWTMGYWGNLAMPTRKEKRKPGTEAPEESSEGFLKSLVARARAVPGPRVCVVGGRTGVGKTHVLHALRDSCQQRILDLEGVAQHRGSTFGWVGQGGLEQPSSEQFGNELAMIWRGLGAGSDSECNREWIFIEDEDSHIGNVTLPPAVYAILRCAPLVVRINIGKKARVQLLIDMYCGAEACGDNKTAWLEGMEASLNRLQKRLGDAAVKALVERLHAGDFEHVAEALLGYYDKLYDKHVANSGGTGSGGGTRPGCVVDVSQKEDLDVLDPVALARRIVDAVSIFEAAAGCSVAAG